MVSKISAVPVNKASEPSSKTRPNSSTAFTGSIVEHTHGLQTSPLGKISTSSQVVLLIFSVLLHTLTNFTSFLALPSLPNQHLQSRYRDSDAERWSLIVILGIGHRVSTDGSFEFLI